MKSSVKTSKKEKKMSLSELIAQNGGTCYTPKTQNQLLKIAIASRDLQLKMKLWEHATRCNNKAAH